MKNGKGDNLMMMSLLRCIHLCKKGAATVEAALLYPMVFMIVVFLIIAGAVCYQRLYFCRVVGKAAGSITSSVTMLSKENILDTGGYHINAGREIYDSNRQLNEAIRVRLQNVIGKDLKRYVVFPFAEQTLSVEINIKNEVFYRNLHVNVKAACKVPFSALFGRSRSGGYLWFHEKASIILYDTTTLARNIDLIEDSLKRSGLKDKADRLIQDLVRPVKTVLEKVHTWRVR